MGLNFYMADLIFRKILRQNADTSWAVHFTSKIYYPARIKRGKGVFPGDSPNNYIEASNGIEIGDHTNLGPGVGLISANHNLINNSVHDPAPPIRIGNYCWLGMNSVVLPGVELGDFTVVAAGAVVSSSFPEGHCVIGGVPAQILKKLDKAECEQYRNSINK